MSLILFLIIGAIAGWIAGKLLRGGGFGLIGNLVVGIVGAVIGGHLFSYLGVSAGGGLIGSLVTAVIGALVLLFIVGLLKKAS
ncbi:transglycosylase [Pseudomonas alcaligenes]|uniref:Transglycosylase n=1 Tax=Aquipseudomonas alcaligenes TaxID=43263 RepID=A0ABR7RZE3_AQUAC|nr:GlsB/YeaQ/YmgE family stress response membrane protein [Pseudomonas alcaligenes]MBC9250094.1 transglycosylase [Pseudomonas alcaligenes]